MKTNIEITNIETKQVVLKSALISDIELKNGEKTQIITIFNNRDCPFEEIKIGLDTAIKRIVEFYPHNIKTVQTTLNGITKTGLKPFFFYKKTEF